jgi:polar amino acid transport system substrate-binding protein
MEVGVMKPTGRWQGWPAVFGALVLLLGLHASGFEAAAQGGGGSSTLGAIKQRGALRQCTFMGYKPMSYLDSKGQATGFDVKLGEAMAKSLGVKFELVDSAFENLIAGVQSGRCDLILSSMTPRAQRAQSVLFARLYVPFVMALIVRNKETRSTIKQFDRNDVTFCVQLGTFSEFTQKKYFPQVKVHQLNNMVDCALEVQSGKADAATFDDIASHDYAKEHPTVKVILGEGGQLGTVSAAPAVALGNVEFKEWIDTFMLEFIQSGEYEKLFREQLGFKPDINLLLLQR